MANYQSDVFQLGMDRQPSEPARRAFHQGYNAHMNDDISRKREQRRYEIARDVLAAIHVGEALTKDTTRKAWAHAAVATADALISALAVEQEVR